MEKEERATTGLAFSFAAGVFAAGTLPLSHISIQASAALFCCIISSALFFHTGHRQAVIPLGLCLGIFTGLTGMISSISLSSSPGPVSSIALRAGTSVRQAIDALPFKDRSTNAIISAFLTGNRTGIPQDLAGAFRDSGASHILALSGLHLGIIYGIINGALKAAGNSRIPRITRSVLVIIVCTAYTIATGAGSSLVRALIFIIIRETGKIIGRDSTLTTVLPVSLIIQLTLFPEDIRSVGFQLSYAAIAGIAYIQPRLQAFWNPERKGLPRRIWDSAAVSISCQITTGPIAYFHFGTFPKYFLITNLIAIPLTGLVIPLAIAVLCLSAAGICPGILISATEALVKLLSGSLEIISML